jgi:hypothetical protein
MTRSCIHSVFEKQMVRRTNLTTCSAIADAFDSASHDQLTRMLHGTWSGHTLLNLALRTLFTVAGGYRGAARMPSVHFRRHGMGRFNTLLVELSKDPAMIV